MKFKQESMQLLHYNQLLGKFTVNQEALQVISSLDRPLSVISVAGAYRTGKSYLLNQLVLGKPKAFEVGETMNAQTKGLWIWGKPIPAEDQHGNPFYHLVIDSEGIGSTDQDFSHDCKLLLLVFYLSSTLIYNSLGVIDENALNNFREILEIQKHLGSRKEELGMPSFVWVLRDFSLELVDREGQPLTEDEYLEMSLQETEATTEAQLRKNNIRRAIKQFFRERHCFTMVRPILDEVKLQQLSNQSRSSLRPDFVEKMKSIRQQIFRGIARPKLYEGVEINGPILCKMIESYVERINESTYPVVSNLWSAVCASTNNDLSDQLLMELEERVRSIKLPQDSQTLSNTLHEIERQALRQFESKAFKNKQFYQLLEEAKDRAKKLRKLVKTKNEAINSDLGRQQIDVLYGKHIRSKFKEDCSGMREAVSTFVNALKCITPRQKILVDRFRELLLWLDGKRLKELEQKEGLNIELQALKTEVVRLQQFEGIKEKCIDLERKFSDKMEDEAKLKGKLSELQESHRNLEAAFKRQRQLISERQQVLLEKEQQYTSTISNLNNENKRLLDEFNKQMDKKGDNGDKLLQNCFDKFESEREWWKQREEVYKKTIKDISERMAVAESSLMQQTERAAKQKKAYIEKQRFFEEQVRELKKTITETKSSYEKTSETLTRNNNLLRVIENMKNNENDRSSTKQHRRALVESRENQEQGLTVKKLQQELSQARMDLRTALHRAELLEAQLADQKRTYEKRLQVEKSSGGVQLIEQNKDLVAKCKVLQMQNQKLQVEKSYASQKMEAVVQNLTKARNRDRTLYEESIRKLLVNIDRKELEVDQDPGRY